MDARRNPFAPGAGTPPPELAGRDALIERAAVALDRIRAGRSARSFIFYGLRGVGKTVLLNHVRLDAEAAGATCVRMEAPEERSLPPCSPPRCAPASSASAAAPPPSPSPTARSAPWPASSAP